MGDGINTPFDAFMLILIMGGIPFLFVALPLIIAPFLYRVTRRLLSREPKLTAPNEQTA